MLTLLMALFAGMAAAASAGKSTENSTALDPVSTTETPVDVQIDPASTPEPVEVESPTPDIILPQQGEVSAGNANITVPLGDSFTSTAYAGRVQTLDLEDDTVVGIEVLSNPAHGNVTVNPDNTLALVLSDTQDTSDVTFSVRLTYTDGSTEDHDVEVDVIAGPQGAGWGMGEFFMLETDDDDRVVVEHGENHQKLHISGSDDALTINDIAILEGLEAGDINWKFFSDNPEYGTDPEEPLDQEAGRLAWEALMADPEASSDWMLLERGYDYDSLGRLYGPDSQGESELNPLYLGAFGEGADPRITEDFATVKQGAENIVIQGIDFEHGITFLNGKNILIDDVSMGSESNIQNVDGFTFRHVDVVDVANETPRNGESWEPHYDRESGIFISKSSHVLFEDTFFDHNGWADDYDPAGDISGGMPPSMFSHNIYIQYDNLDFTFRDNISMRGAASGVQMRAGGFIEDNVIIDNNGAINFEGGGDKLNGNYTLFTDNLVTSGGHKEADQGQGALTSGISNQADLTSLVDNIITHLADPNNPNELEAKYHGQNPYRSDEDPYYDDTIIHNWVGSKNDEEQDARNLNTEGLDHDVLNETTIQNFTAQLLGTETATIEDLANFLRAQYEDQSEDVVDADLINAFFQSGFGISTTLRADAETLRFMPSDLADGMRWDNRLNWSTEDLPGTQDGDSIDLAGNWVYYGGTTTVDTLDFGDGGKLFVSHGYLEVSGELGADGEGGTIGIDGSGQFWTDGYAGTAQMTIEADGGRFGNTGNFDGHVDMALSDNAQALLASNGGQFTFGAGSSLTVTGGDVKVGFDGEDGTTGLLTFDEGATVNYLAEDGEIGEIREFYSGHYMSEGDGVLSGIALNGADLVIDISSLEGGSSYTLMSADEIIGSFASLEVLGLASDQDVSILIDYEADEITFNLGAAGTGSGQQNLYLEGIEIATPQEQSIWDILTAGHGIYPDDPDMPEDDLLQFDDI
jgi:hypothetical protein